MSFATTADATQFAASDGAGPGTRTAAVTIIWVAFCILPGGPLALVGMKLSQWRIPQAMGIGLAAGVCSWAALINTVSAPGISDNVLVIVVLCFFLVAFLLGLLPVMRIGGTAILALLGGVAFGLRIALLKTNLLIPVLVLNWVLTAIFGVAFGILVVWRTRIGFLLGMTSAGTFLLALAVDLLSNGNKGVSIGLRLLFDNNGAHVAAFSSLKYTPTVSTQVTLGVSLVLTPALAFMQHRMFPEPPPSILIWESSNAVMANMDLSLPTVMPGATNPTDSVVWNTFKKKSSPSRFSM